jgi:hypothetical protein
MEPLPPPESDNVVTFLLVIGFLVLLFKGIIFFPGKIGDKNKNKWKI